MAASAVVRLKLKKKSYDTPQELELIHRAKKGDEHAFRALYDSHQGRVFITINRMLLNDDTSQWVALETFTKVWKNLARFKGNSKFSTWVTRIAINEARMYIRSQKRHQREVSLDTLLGSTRDSGSVAEQRNLQNEAWLAMRDTDLEGIPDRQVLERAISRVPTQFRSVLRMKFWEGMSLDEIQVKLSAEELRPVSIPAVKSRILRGKNILMEQVERIS
jgi:RNA polymerase sigma-70 factor, ECF subfamily